MHAADDPLRRYACLLGRRTHGVGRRSLGDVKHDLVIWDEDRAQPADGVGMAARATCELLNCASEQLLIDSRPVALDEIRCHCLHAMARRRWRKGEIPSIDTLRLCDGELRDGPQVRKHSPMSVRLLAIPGSHPCGAVAAMLEAKGIAYDRVDLIPGFSRVWLRVSGFGAGTAPALRMDGVRVQGSRAIARALDARRPEPRLFPADPADRARVEEIEAWGDGPLQDASRRIILWALTHNREAARAGLAGARLQFHFPVALAARVAWPVLRLDAALNSVHAGAVRSDLAALPAMFDQIDTWIARGELDTGLPTAADYQLAGSVRMLLTIEDLAPQFAGRPAEELARRLIPRFPGRVPAGTLPAAWVP
jgi:glutathione S-transferase